MEVENDGPVAVRYFELPLTLDQNVGGALQDVESALQRRAQIDRLSSLEEGHFVPRIAAVSRRSNGTIYQASLMYIERYKAS